MTKRNSELFFEKLAPYMLESELENVKAAYVFSKYAHSKALRDDGSRYFDHPKEVAIIIIDEFHITNWKIICTALLHDVLEDTYMFSEHRLTLNFGEDVCRWVKLLSKTKGMSVATYIKRLEDCGKWEALFVKLVDRLHNTRTLHNCSEEKIVRKKEETKKYYLPLANTLTNMHRTEAMFALEEKLNKLVKTP